MKHSGSCDKQCGHLLDTGHCKTSALRQQALNSDPRVVEYVVIPATDLTEEQFEFIYARHRPVEAIHHVNARHAGIPELTR